MFSVSDVTARAGKCMSTRNKLGAYKWGTTVKDESTCPYTNHKMRISSTWEHCKGVITHISRAVQTPIPNLKEEKLCGEYDKAYKISDHCKRE